jgi:hypothetical protein
MGQVDEDDRAEGASTADDKSPLSQYYCTVTSWLILRETPCAQLLQRPQPLPRQGYRYHVAYIIPYLFAL